MLHDRQIPGSASESRELGVFHGKPGNCVWGDDGAICCSKSVV